MARLFDFELSFLGRKHFAENIIDGVGVSSFRSIHSHRSMAMYLTNSFPNRSWQYLFSIPLAEQNAHGKSLRNRQLICIIGISPLPGSPPAP